MRNEYTVKASVIYELAVIADDEDEALELAQRHQWRMWQELAVDYFIDDVQPVTLAPRGDHVDD